MHDIQYFHLPSLFLSFAIVSLFVFFKDSACALPRPSATDSAKFANSTVINKITVTIPLYSLNVLSSPNTVGMIVITNLAVGMVTPPVGVNLFVVCEVAQLKMHQLARYLVVFLAVLIIDILIISYVPALSTAFL